MDNIKKRVVVTGIGILSPIGCEIDDVNGSLINGKSGISNITHFDTNEYSSQIAGEVKNFDPHNYIDKRESKKMDRFIQFAVAATSKAIKNAKLNIDDNNAERVGVVIGSGIGGLQTMETQHRNLLDGGQRKVSPFMVPMMIVNMAAGQISIIFGAKGPSYATVSACSSGAHAIGEAFESILRGDIDAAITGGSEAPITPLGVAGFCSLRALSTRNDEPEKASRPFDVDRDGFVMGEGAGILILEELNHAKQRNADILCEIIGYGSTSDAYHIVQPSANGEGAERCIRFAMKKSGISDMKSVTYINAHGTSTKFNDELETKAIKKVFGDYAYDMYVSSTKSMTGHLLGAAGAIEAIFIVLAIKNKFIPPTINLDNPDPECDLNYVANKSIDHEIDIALSNSFGFGGQNVTLAFKKWEE